MVKKNKTVSLDRVCDYLHAHPLKRGKGHYIQHLDDGDVSITSYYIEELRSNLEDQ